MMYTPRSTLYRWIFPKWQWKGPNQRAVYLTFDDGPHPEATPLVLDILQSYGIKATFFCVGQNASKFPELMKRIKEDGHNIGNHTFSHEHGWKTPLRDYVQSVEKTTSFIDSSLFRPPYGKINLKTANRLRKSGFSIIMWSWLSYDYKKNLTEAEIIQKAKNIRGGDILVFHDSQKTHSKISTMLPPIIDIIAQKNLTFDLI